MGRLVGALALVWTLTVQAAEVTVSAAASLGEALRELASVFEASNSAVKLRLNLGASGALLQQIAKGAPVDVFVSADEETMDQAQRQALIDPQSRRDLLSNTLVVIVPAGAPSVPASLTDLADMAASGRYARIAIGLPASVPAGRYARLALEAAGIWKTVEAKTIAANSVRQALDYVARGEANAGFVYATDAAIMPDKVKVAMKVDTVKPIRYPVAIVSGAPNPAAARQFVDFLFTEQAQNVFAKHGFGKP
jgi:molybdate transport system substrate-binding protein